MSEHQTEAEAGAALARAGIRAKTIEVKAGTDRSCEVLLIPSGDGAVEAVGVKKFLDEYLEAPERRKGTAKLLDLDSFIAHAKRQAGKDSALFAAYGGDTTPAIVCVYDYNPAGGDATKAAFGQHRAAYSFPISEEWKAWTKANGKGMNQQEFAEFIENRINDVVDPSDAGETAREFAEKLGCSLATPSKLLELSRGLSVRVGAAVRNHVNLASGEAQIQYETSHTSENGSPLKVPGALLLGLPIFRNGAHYQIPARLRYRVTGGQVAWFFELYRTDAALDHAVREACERAQEETELPLFYGSPEAG